MRSMANILVLHGPNLNLLGVREPKHYGLSSLEHINAGIVTQGNSLGHHISCYQSNSEHSLIDKIQQATTEQIAFIIFNPAAFTHTSIALRDAILAVGIPFIEVHLSNVYAREAFRHHSYFSDIAVGVITGLGDRGYTFALNAAHHFLLATE